MGFDEVVLHWINRPGLTPLDALMSLLSARWFGGLLAAAIAVLLARASRFGWPASLALLAAIGLADLTSARVVKPLAARVRPCNEKPPRSIALEGCGRGPSFPSNHAANAAAAALVAGWVLRRRWLAFATIPLLIGISRVYLGVHWPTDVLAGWALGAAIGALVAAGTAWLLRRRTPAL